MIYLLSVYILASFTLRSYAAPQVQLGQTTLIGKDLTTFNEEFFGGIPFAQPPVGDLRFAPPIPQFSLNVSTFDASSFGPACPQSTNSTDSPPPGDISEDCLFINVIRPAGLTDQDQLPVMVWIYGGGFQNGAGSLDKFNASVLVQQSMDRDTPVIYVNFNYRLGPFGFPQGDEAMAKDALNLGLKDQLTALQWVQENIGAFGGDKSKVTVFGESAGSISLSIQMLNPSFSELARAAILQSGSANTDSLQNASSREQQWQTFASLVPECNNHPANDTFDCLRTATVAQLLAAAAVVSTVRSVFVPVIDGPGGLIPNLPSISWASGSFAKIPFISGDVLDEGTIFTPPNVTNASLTIVINAAPPQEQALLNDLFALYPNDPSLGSPFNTGNETFGLDPEYKRVAAILGDVHFQSVRRLFIQNATAMGIDAWGYEFTDSQIPNGVAARLGVDHGSDVPYVYGNITSSTSAHQLSLNMIDYWLSFATSLTPNDNHGNVGRMMWSQYTPDNQVLIQLNSENTTVIPDNYREEQIDFINSQPASFQN